MEQIRLLATLASKRVRLCLSYIPWQDRAASVKDYLEFGSYHCQVLTVSTLTPTLQHAHCKPPHQSAEP